MFKDALKSDKAYLEAGNIKVGEAYDHLYEVEAYFREQIGDRLEVAYDCVAVENPYFKTLNYTTYGGALVISPLQPEVALIQTHDALLDGKTVPWRDWLSSRAKSKYRGGDKVYGDSKAFLVLCGDNKLYDQFKKERLVKLDKKYKDGLVVKTHPVTQQRVITELKALMPNSIFIGDDYDLYGSMQNTEKVYSTHISESAAFAQAFGKAVEPADKYNARITSAFAHINYHIFLGRDIDGLAGSYKSGIFDPRIHKDWQVRIEQYIEYILQVRETFKGVYL